MATMQTYDLNGKKLSFANWISNLSPTETPFVTMTSKEAVAHTKFQWQVDYLNPIMSHAHLEGEDVDFTTQPRLVTEVKENYTQILRKTLKVSETSNMIATYGRGRELAYQMEKSAQALKRDLEAIFLSDQVAAAGSSLLARKTACFQALVAPKDAKMPDTEAVVHFDSAAVGVIDFEDVKKMFFNLFLANNKADLVMFHPKHAKLFAGLVEAEGNTHLFDGDNKAFSYYVSTIVDEFGREYKLIPNRFMPEDAIYFFNDKDFTQMVLRAPQRIKLAKEGSFEHWMIEMEVGLRLDNPFAAGVLKAKA